MLQVRKIGKRYGREKWALQEVSLDVGPGVIGLLGPNGAGKSTLMRILATVMGATAGTALWRGVDIARSPDILRRELGYLPQDFGVYPNLTAVEFLEYLAAVKGLEPKTARGRVRALLDMVNLAAVARRPLGTYSGGMKQRVGIAQALLNDPKLVIVDEPTTGLDPEERVRFRQLLSDIAGSRIVILSTHIVSDVASVATDVAILHGGRLLLHSTPEALLERVAGKVWEWTVPAEDLPRLRQEYLVCGAVRQGDGLRVRAVADAVAGAQPVPPSLEDAYLYVTLTSAAAGEAGGR
ncbi:MAG: ABC transporter ATP-binding protein [Symbiobacteriia bacterium]